MQISAWDLIPTHDTEIRWSRVRRVDSHVRGTADSLIRLVEGFSIGPHCRLFDEQAAFPRYSNYTVPGRENRLTELCASCRTYLAATEGLNFRLWIACVSRCIVRAVKTYN
jgi:hypothetical protein